MVNIRRATFRDGIWVASFRSADRFDLTTVGTIPMRTSSVLI